MNIFIKTETINFILLYLKTAFVGKNGSLNVNSIKRNGLFNLFTKIFTISMPTVVT